MQKLPEPSHFEALYPPTTREKEVRDILSCVQKGNSCQVVGLPGIGRSTILKLLSYNKAVRTYHLQDQEQWLHFVYMDLSEIKGRSIFDITKFILISLSYSLGERGKSAEQKEVDRLFKEHVHSNDELVLFQALKKAVDHLAIEKELTVVFLFDRFDEYLPTIESQFFSNVRVLRNHAKYRFSSVFSLNRTIEEILEPDIYKDFYDFLLGNTIYVDFPSREELAFRFSYLERVTGKKLDTKAQDELLALTHGHGKVTKLSYEALLSQDTLPNNIQEFLLAKLPVQGALFEIWSALFPKEQQILLGQQAKSMNQEENSYLVKSHLIEQNTIAIPLFERALPQFGTLKPQEEISFDPHKNAFFKGKEELTEKLSPSEFRLLKFLLDNAGRVCTKDEIIDAVWKDQATREGVTDQALDQVIYRLRKKIEEDPNNPQHLRTVKGQGYRLTP